MLQDKLVSTRMHPIQARLTPHISALTELTIVLDLDIHGQQNFCHGKDALNDYPVDQDWVHIMSWAHMAGQATGQVAVSFCKIWNGFHDHGIDHPYIGGTPFAIHHASTSYCPWIQFGLVRQSLSTWLYSLCKICRHHAQVVWICLCRKRC
jgi:hypothetical protein